MIAVVREAPEARLLRRARSPEDAASLARFDTHMALPLVLAALLPLFLMTGEPDSTVAAIIVVASWLVFVLDFVVHERRLVHYLRTWWGRFDLGVVILTAPWFLFFEPSSSKFVMLVRLARLARVLMATSGLRRLFERLGRVALVALIVVVLGAAIAYHAEHPTNPGFATYGDALWWAIVTLTTVGYGDIVPKTPAGRLAGVMIMVTGIGVLGVLAGSLASFFRIDPGKEDQPPDATEGGDPEEPADGTRNDTVLGAIAALQLQVAQLSDAISRLGAARDTGDDDDAL